jgi:hypothetical protein
MGFGRLFWSDPENLGLLSTMHRQARVFKDRNMPHVILKLYTRRAEQEKEQLAEEIMEHGVSIEK